MPADALAPHFTWTQTNKILTMKHIEKSLTIICYFTELDFERLCKKRRLYKEPAVSPIELEDSDRNSPLNYPPRLNPDSLNHTPDYKYKMRFLFDLKLQVVPVERRKRKEIKILTHWGLSRMSWYLIKNIVTGVWFIILYFCGSLWQ